MTIDKHDALRKLLRYAVEEAQKLDLDLTAYLLQQAAVSIEPEEPARKTRAGATLTDFGIKQNPASGEIKSNHKLQ